LLGLFWSGVATEIGFAREVQLRRPRFLSKLLCNNALGS
jgi:hypothetical protein